MVYNAVSKYLPRFIAILLVVVMVLLGSTTAFANEKSGSCGTNLSWNIDSGTLYITGSGDMDDFTEDEMAPWYEYRHEITRIILSNGLTHIGQLAFYDCSNVAVVLIPDSVTYIGICAFKNCEGMEMVSFGKGLKTIDQSAFSDCNNLKAINFPDKLNYIGKKAFYRCETLTSVIVPSSVTGMGPSVFAYCKNLVYADIKAEITFLPENTFYGCEKLVSVSLPENITEIGSHSFRGCERLNTIYCGGEEENLEEIFNSVGGEVDEFVTSGVVTDQKTENKFTYDARTDNADGTFTEEKITVSNGKSSSVTTKLETNKATEESSEFMEITVNVNGDEGWQEAKAEVEKSLETNRNISDGIVLDVYVENTESIDQSFLDSVSGKDITVNFITQNGSKWQINGLEIDTESKNQNYDLSYEITPGSKELCEKLGTDVCFVLKFLSSAEINAKIMIPVERNFKDQKATLLQGEKIVQTSLVDGNGYVRFYLASVSEKTEYYIAMNLPGTEEAIIPENMLEEYGNLGYIEPIKYEITGRKSSWGMNLGQVMGILGAVMVGVAVLVGTIMFIWNKQKLRKGYVPTIDDEDYDEE